MSKPTKTQEFEDLFEGLLTSFVDPVKHQKMRDLLEEAFMDQYVRGQCDERSSHYERTYGD